MTQDKERPTREDFEEWSVRTNQGYDLARNQSGAMRTFENEKTDHAWRGFCHGWIAARRAPGVPEGWRLVPTDASLNMLHAGWGICSLNGQPVDAKTDSARTNYAAMLAAAPQPPEGREKLDAFIGAAKDAGITHLPKSFGKALREHLSAPEKAGCWCETCRPQTLEDMRFIVCPDCGNKRCPKANNHANACTNSNAVGQPGSSWEHVKPWGQRGEAAPVERQSLWRAFTMTGSSTTSTRVTSLGKQRSTQSSKFVPCWRSAQHDRKPHSHHPSQPAPLSRGFFTSE